MTEVGNFAVKDWKKCLALKQFFLSMTCGRRWHPPTLFWPVSHSGKVDCCGEGVWKQWGQEQVWRWALGEDESALALPHQTQRHQTPREGEHDPL